MRKMHWVVVKGPTLIILSPYYQRHALGGGVVKGPTQIILNPYYDNTEPIL